MQKPVLGPIAAFFGFLKSLPRQRDCFFNISLPRKDSGNEQNSGFLQSLPVMNKNVFTNDLIELLIPILTTSAYEINTHKDIEI